jgi:hypothetical protein
MKKGVTGSASRNSYQVQNPGANMAPSASNS